MNEIDAIALPDLIQSIATQLDKRYQNKTLCTQYAWWVIEAITQQKKSSLVAQQIITLTTKQRAQLDDWINQQLNDNIPLQYLIGSVPFISATIVVEPPTLIPRPETENWVAELIARLQQLNYQAFTLLDLCTGSGCIAIALAQAFPQSTIYATDISTQALALAKKNALHNNVSNIKFIASDLFRNIPSTLSFDMIIANPPYIGQQEWHTLEPSVREWEDRVALIADNEGTGILRDIIIRAPNYLNPHQELSAHLLPHLAVEIGCEQGPIIESLFQEAGFCDTVIEKDLQGHDRVVSGCINNEAPTT